IGKAQPGCGTKQKFFHVPPLEVPCILSCRRQKDVTFWTQSGKSSGHSTLVNQRRTIVNAATPRLTVGGSMTVISLGHVSRSGKTAIIRAIRVGQFSKGNSRLIGPARLRDWQPRFGTSGPQEFAGGFVDFLLGRGSRGRR